MKLALVAAGAGIEAIWGMLIALNIAHLICLGVQHGIQVLFHGSPDHLVRGDPDLALIDLYNLTLCYRLFGWSSLVCNIGLAINVLTNWGHLLQKSVHDLIYVINVRDKSSALCVRESRLGSVGMSWFDLGSCVRCF